MNQDFGDNHVLSLASEPKKAVSNDLDTNDGDSNPVQPNSKGQTKQKKRKKEKKLKFKKLRKRPRTEALTLPNNVFRTNESSSSSASDNASIGTASVFNATVASSLPSTAEENTCIIAKATAAIRQENKPSHSNSIPILPREKLLEVVQAFDNEAKAEFAWKYHNRQRKKGGTQFWYDFRPHEKYCADNAFVPLMYSKLLPSDTPKSQVKRKTTAMVLKQGIQGIHFAIGWVELYHLIVEGGVFAGDDNPHPTLLALNPPPLDPNGRKSPTKGIDTLKDSSHKSHRAARAKQTPANMDDSHSSDSENDYKEMPDSALKSRVTPHDVCFGKRFQNHPGNVQLRNLTEQYSYQFDSCQDRQEQFGVARQVQKQLQGVRFWKENGKEASSKEVLNKIWVRLKNHHYYRLRKKNKDAKEKPDAHDDDGEDNESSSSFGESGHEELNEHDNDATTDMPDLAVKSKMLPHDVCFGKRMLKHPGNVQLRNLAEEHLCQFAVCQNRQEQLVIAETVQQLLLSKGVRFWKENGKEVSPKEVLHKICKCMENQHYYRSKKKNSSATPTAVVKDAKQKADAYRDDGDEGDDQSIPSFSDFDGDDEEEEDDDDTSVESFEFDCGPPDSAFNNTPLKQSPAPQDVLFGRGGALHRHPGNLQFRAVTEEFASQFDSAMTPQEQYAIAEKVHCQLLSMGVRFWKENGTEASPKEVVGKIWRCWKNKYFRDKYKGGKVAAKKPARQDLESAAALKNDNGSEESSDCWEFDTEDAGEKAVAKKPARQDLKSAATSTKDDRSVSSDWEFDTKDDGVAKKPAPMKDTHLSNDEPISSDWEFDTEDEKERVAKKQKEKKKPSKKKGPVKSTFKRPSTTQSNTTSPNSPEPYKWANWKPSTPRGAPPAQYIVDHYNGAVDV